MIADTRDRKAGLATDGLGVVVPIGWSLQAAAFSWLEEPVHQRSAGEIYARLAQRRPDVMLKSRVPTHTLPCCEYAAGDWLGHGLEVAVTGEDYSVRVTLVEKLGASWPLVLASSSAIEEIRALTDHRTSMKHLSLSVAMLGLDRDVANARFTKAIGLAIPDAAVVNQSYHKTIRKQIGSNHGSVMDVAFELATAGDHGEMHSLILTSQTRTLSLSNSGDQEDWAILLRASLETIASITV